MNKIEINKVKELTKELSFINCDVKIWLLIWLVHNNLVNANPVKYVDYYDKNGNYLGNSKDNIETLLNNILESIDYNEFVKAYKEDNF